MILKLNKKESNDNNNYTETDNIRSSNSQTKNKTNNKKKEYETYKEITRDLILYKIDKYLDLFFSLIYLKFPFTHVHLLQLTNIILIKTPGIKRKIIKLIDNLTNSKRFSLNYYLPLIASICLLFGEKVEKNSDTFEEERKTFEMGKILVINYLKSVKTKLSKHINELDKYYKYLPELIIINLSSLIIYNPNLNIMFQLSQDDKNNKEKNYFSKIFKETFKLMKKTLGNIDSTFLVNLLINLNKENLNEINDDLLIELKNFKDDFICCDNHLFYNLGLNNESIKHNPISFDSVKNNLVIQLIQILNGDYNDSFRWNIKEYKLPLIAYMKNELSGLFIIKKYYDEEEEEMEKEVGGNTKENFVNENKNEDLSALEINEFKNNDKLSIMNSKQKYKEPEINESSLLL